MPRWIGGDQSGWNFLPAAIMARPTGPNLRWARHASPSAGSAGCEYVGHVLIAEIDVVRRRHDEERPPIRAHAMPDRLPRTARR
jgi:hypothetical protein